MSDERRRAARDGYVFGYAMVENYRTMYAQAVDETDHRYVGGFGTYRHYPQPATPENTDIVTPNNDTPYSWAWLDLRAEPWVVTVPAMDRYFILPFHDLYTVYAGYVGAATTGSDGGSYLLAGPRWDGEVPDGISGVVRASTDLVGTLTRTELTGDGVGSLTAVQKSYGLEPLSRHAGTTPPGAAGPVSWPVWDEDGLTRTVQFYLLLDFLLQFAPVLPEDADVRRRLAALGIDGSGTFSLTDLDPEARADLQAGLEDGVAALAERAGTTASSFGLFGDRQQMSGKYIERAMGAMKGLYGLPPSEAWYGGWLLDAHGERPTGRRTYTVTFGPDDLPKVRFFWSATMYRLPERLLVANPLDRYSIGDRTDGIQYEPDGSLVLTIARERPADPRAAANWLPAPEGPFTVILRAYGGDERITSGAYKLPPLTPAD
jgi:hypothetical protein